MGFKKPSSHGSHLSIHQELNVRIFISKSYASPTMWRFMVMRFMVMIFTTSAWYVHEHGPPHRHNLLETALLLYQ